MATKVKYYDDTGKSYDGYNIEGKTYKDEAGTQRIDGGSYVQTGDTWWKMGNTGGEKVNTPYFAGGWIGEIKPKETATKQATQYPTMDSSGYNQQLNNLLSAIQTYKPQTVETPYPNVNNFNFDGYQDQLNNILTELKNYTPTEIAAKYPELANYDFSNIQTNLNNITQGINDYKGADYMSREESLARANAQLGGMYSQGLENTLNEYNKNAIQRGMFGQLPVEALKQNAIAENELNKSSAINQYSNDIYQQDFNIAQQQNADFYNKANTLSNNYGQLYNMEVGEYNTATQDYMNQYNMAKQQDADYLNRLNQQISLIGQQYGIESDQYQSAVADYMNQFNITQQNNNNFYNNVNAQLGIIGSQYDIGMDKYNIDRQSQQDTINQYLSTIGQFSNDYMAEINRVKGDNNPSNDWQIAYLQNARNQKIAGQNQSQSEAQSTQYKQAMDMFSKLGYASGWVAQALGLPEGTTTASYANSLRSKSSGSGGSPKAEDTTPKIDTQELTSAARLLANQLYPDGLYSREQFQEVYDYLYTLWTTGKPPSNYVPSRSPDTNAPNILDILSKNGMLDGNDNYSTQDDYDLFNFLNE